VPVLCPRLVGYRQDSCRTRVLHGTGQPCKRANLFMFAYRAPGGSSRRLSDPPLTWIKPQDICLGSVACRGSLAAGLPWIRPSLSVPCYFPDRAANRRFGPCCGETSSLFGEKISLFAKPGKSEDKSLIRGAARRAIRRSPRASCRFRCIPDHREFAAVSRWCADSSPNRSASRSNSFAVLNRASQITGLPALFGKFPVPGGKLP